MLPRRVSMALACSGAVGALLTVGVATLPAAAGAAPSAAVAPQDNPAPTSGTDPSQSGIVTIVPTTTEAPTTEAPTTNVVPSSEPATRSAAPTRARTTPRATATATARASFAPTTARTRAATSTAAVTGAVTSTGSTSGGSAVTYDNGPLDLPTDLAASQGPVAFVTSRAAGGRSVLVPASSSAPERKVGSFSLNSVLITTVIGALLAAAVGGAGLWFTRRQGTRLSDGDQPTSLPPR